MAAAARYVSDSDFKGKVKVTGLGTPNQMRAYVEDGTVDAFALWNPEDLGYLAAFAAKALVDGDITGKEGEQVHRRQAR
ncbi:substrate-binding domain-containing protein [Aeromicrobium sp. UC242_57]|uniref:substrate-binding domain-containing protein n=1 Tax=Aeromicrobium sp. UC242_57 TaxID=3374624 RepID=UPI0037ADAFF6